MPAYGKFARIHTSLKARPMHILSSSRSRHLRLALAFCCVVAATCAIPATVIEAPDRSPLGVWRGYLECGSNRFGLEITLASGLPTPNGFQTYPATVRHQKRTDRADIMTEGRGTTFGPRFGAEYRADMRYDSRVGRVVVERGQWVSRSERGISIVDFDLTWDGSGTLSGSAREVPGTMTPIARGWPEQSGCRTARLSRIGLPAALEDAQARLERRPSVPSAERSWPFANGFSATLQCAAGTFNVRLFVSATPQQFFNSPIVPGALDKLSVALRTECPSADTAAFSVQSYDWESGPFEWPAQDRQRWTWSGASVRQKTLLPSGKPSLELPSLFSEPVGNAPFDDRGNVLKQRWRDAVQAYQRTTANIAPRIDSDTRGRGLNWLLERFAILSRRDRDASQELRGRWFYLNALLSLGFVDSKPLNIYTAQDSAAGREGFLVCAKQWGLRDCALLLEYYEEASGNSGADARKTLSLANVPTTSVASLLTDSVAQLAAYVERKEPFQYRSPDSAGRDQPSAAQGRSSQDSGSAGRGREDIMEEVRARQEDRRRDQEERARNRSLPRTN